MINNIKKLKRYYKMGRHFRYTILSSILIAYDLVRRDRRF